VLVIPAIEIEGHRCYRSVQMHSPEAAEVYPTDPVESALLWRKENAKSLHVTDYDGLYAGHMDNVEEILSMAGKIEIPLMLLARFESIDECRMWLDGGIYRIVVHDLLIREPDTVTTLLAGYGPSRVVAGAVTRDGKVCPTWRESECLDSVEFARRAEEIGVRRIFFTDRNYEGEMGGPNFREIRRLADSTALPITAAGGVATVEHLWRLQDLEKQGVDSVVIGRAFYENRFPCQQLWRDVELDRRRSSAADEQTISTSRLR
jgi:phosphoribosylformimino-5-aminoimidazole carboxamide ribotide isomerase